ncbi:hypothetical protein WFZ85_13320 [Flavobacterium sp. j3]|uniref:Uncharacterized protein n=1 Tax=Flavobacterium aureirubrum TaxID=3133147 RepID=A0ABU9N7V0_9FLAO
MKQRHQQKLVFISIVLLLGFNIPLLLLFDSASSFLGFPVIYIYIFSAWLFSVLLSFIIIKRYHE